jgi:DNA-directed RNA polymerase specialized sigma24 family protein
VTNVPIGTVMSRLARARAALKARWLTEAQGAPHAVR